jgi:rubredoxin
MEKHRCKMCRYVYDPTRGDPVNGVRSGTPFTRLPPTWVCPVCGAAKSEFENVPA